MMRHHPTRDLQRPVASTDRPPVLGLDATYTDAYLRAAVGGVNSGPWLQLTIGSLGFKGTTEPDRTAGASILADTLERRRTETQYIASGGMTLGALRLEVVDRLRAIRGSTYNAASARGDLAIPFTTVSGFIEHDGVKGNSADVGARFQPLPFFALSGSFANTSSTGGSSAPTLTSVRGEAAIKLFRPWASVGLITADRVAGLAPLVYDTLFLPTEAGKITAKTASLRGPIAAGFGVDAWVTQWDEPGAYRPKYESRSELNYSNDFRRRFPRGDLAVRAAGVYEYRSHTPFPSSAGDVETPVAKTLSVLLEIRILRAVVSFQQRNLLGYQYSIVPGFEMPRVLAIYGVRWEFWN